MHVPLHRKGTLVDSALNPVAPPAHGRPPAPHRSRRHALRVGAAAVLAGALVWPSVGAPALAATPAAAGAQVVAAAEPQGPGSLSGRVTDGTGAPLEGVRVHVSGEVPLGVPETGADGTWTVEGVPAGSYHVRFELRDEGGWTWAVYWDGTPLGSTSPLQSITLGEGEDRGGLDATYLFNGATGTVTDGQAPVAGATVGFYARSIDPEPVRAVTTAADGTWTVHSLSPGTYVVKVTPPAGSGLAPAWWNSMFTFTGSAPRTVRGIDVVLPVESRLVGRVVDEAGAPVAGTRIALWTRSGGRPVVAAHATTGADGTYTFRGLVAQSYTVQVVDAEIDPVVPDYLGGVLAFNRAVWVAVGAQDEVTVANLVQRVGGTISGVVVAEPGWDGPGITVELLGPDGSVVARVPAYERSGDPDFETSGAVPAGLYRLRAPLPGDGYWWVGGTSFETARVLDLRPGAAITDVELVLSDAFLGTPPAPTQALTADNSGGLRTAAPVRAGGTASIVGLEQPASSYVWLAPSLQGLGYGQVGADGTLQVRVPASTPVGAYRLAVATPGGFLLGWADLTVTAAPDSGAAPGQVPTAAPSAATVAAAAPAPTVSPAARGVAGSGQRSGPLAATGFNGTWLAGGGLAAVLLGAGLVMLRRRRA